MDIKKTRAEKRESKRRKRMKVSGKRVIALARLIGEKAKRHLPAKIFEPPNYTSKK